MTGLYDRGVWPPSGFGSVLPANNEGADDKPIIFSCVNQVVNFGIHKLENALLGSLLIVSKLLGGSQSKRAAC